MIFDLFFTLQQRTARHALHVQVFVGVDVVDFTVITVDVLFDGGGRGRGIGSLSVVLTVLTVVVVVLDGCFGQQRQNGERWRRHSGGHGVRHRSRSFHFHHRVTVDVALIASQFVFDQKIKNQKSQVKSHTQKHCLTQTIESRNLSIVVIMVTVGSCW